MDFIKETREDFSGELLAGFLGVNRYSLDIHKEKEQEVIDGAESAGTKARGAARFVTGTLHNSDCWSIRCKDLG